MSKNFKDELKDRPQCVMFAKLAEQVEQYEDMVCAMKKAVGFDTETPLTTEERNLLSVAYKNVVGARRSAWRIISSIENKSKDGSNKQQCQAYKEKIEKELMDTCNEVIDLVEKFIQPKLEEKLKEDNSTSNVEAVVFFKKMLGDYCRYTVECKEGPAKSENTQKAAEHYKAAYEAAQENMKSTNPIRLGLALNYSVFYFEILNDPTNACKLAKESFDQAISELDSLPEESYKDSTLIMQLLRDNLTLWTSEQDGQEED